MLLRFPKKPAGSDLGHGHGVPWPGPAEAWLGVWSADWLGVFQRLQVQPASDDGLSAVCRCSAGLLPQEPLQRGRGTTVCWDGLQMIAVNQTASSHLSKCMKVLVVADIFQTPFQKKMESPWSPGSWFFIHAFGRATDAGLSDTSCSHPGAKALLHHLQAAICSW